MRIPHRPVSNLSESIAVGTKLTELVECDHEARGKHRILGFQVLPYIRYVCEYLRALVSCDILLRISRGPWKWTANCDSSFPIDRE